MNIYFKASIIIISTAAMILLGSILILPKPILLQGMHYSQAVYDDNSDQRHLLDLTLTPEQQYRLYTPLAQIPHNLINATLLQEDQYYYYHPGINPIALMKALVATYILHERKRGASTITMQVARIEFHLYTRTFLGKLTQIFKALQLEFYYSKDQILEAYLNLAPYGGNVQGAGAASLIYFGKPINKLNLSELLMLAVIPQNPVKRSPTLYQNQQLFLARNILFSRWQKHYPQSIMKLNQALMYLPLQLHTLREVPFLAPHFVFDVLANHPHQKILNTTINLKLQNIITEIATSYCKNNYLHNYAIILVDTRTMGVKALIGSADFFNKQIQGQINGTNSERSPGSALKPFIYALALQQGLIHPLSILKDAPRYFGLYAPENFDRDYAGPINATKALITSRNIPAVVLMQQLQHPSFYQFLQQAQINLSKSAAYYGLSLALGGENITMQQMVQLYAMLVNGGDLKPLRFLQNSQQVQGKQLLTPEAAFLVLNMLKSNPRPNVISTAAQILTLPVYWKTGTSSRFRDAWSVGIFGPYVLAVWVGDFHNKTHQQFIGIKTAAPLFFSIIDAIEVQTNHLQDLIHKQYKKLNLVKIKVCEASGLLPTPNCPKIAETWFIPGVSPIKRDNVFREVLIDTHTGLRACQVSSTTKFVVYEFWPSDLESLFESAGIHHAIPPPYNASCGIQAKIGVDGLPPQIISPRKNLVYSFYLNTHENSIIPFIAIADDDVKTIYWFIDQNYIGKSAPNKSINWQAKSGNYMLRAVDDHGRSDVFPLQVTVVN